MATPHTAIKTPFVVADRLKFKFFMGYIKCNTVAQMFKKKKNNWHNL